MFKILKYGVLYGLVGAVIGTVVQKRINTKKDIEERQKALDELQGASDGVKVAQIDVETGEVEYVTPSDYAEEMYGRMVERLTTPYNRPESRYEEELEYEETDDLTFDTEEDTEEDLVSRYDHVKPEFNRLIEKGELITLHLAGIDSYEYREVFELTKLNKEELEFLNHNKDSNEAMMQYKAMRLADIQKEKWYDVLYRLFDYTFDPQNEMDESIALGILDYREEFFGMDSIWYNKVTMAEVILHFAELMSLDHGESVDFYAEELVENTGLEPTGDHFEWARAVDEIQKHTFSGQNGWGIFGLKDPQQARTDGYFFSEYNNSSYFEE